MKLSFKVICIDASGLHPFYEAVFKEELVEGCVYTPLPPSMDSGVSKKSTDEYYLLFIEKANNKTYFRWFKKSRFIPLSEIDETESINQEKESYELS